MEGFLFFFFSLVSQTTGNLTPLMQEKGKEEKKNVTL